MPRSLGAKNLTYEAKLTICQLADQGVPTSLIASATGVTMRTIQHVIKDHCENTLCPPKTSPGRPRIFDDRDLRALRQTIKKNCQQTL